MTDSRLDVIRAALRAGGQSAECLGVSIAWLARALGVSEDALRDTMARLEIEPMKLGRSGRAVRVAIYDVLRLMEGAKAGAPRPRGPRSEREAALAELDG